MTKHRDTHKAPPGLTADKAFNQLVAVLSGRETALATEHLKTSPHQRIQQCHEMALEELEVLKAREEMNGRKADTRQLKRKLSSIQSLLRLAELVYEGVDGEPADEESSGERVEKWIKVTKTYEDFKTVLIGGHLTNFEMEDYWNHFWEWRNKLWKEAGVNEGRGSGSLASMIMTPGQHKGMDRALGR